MTVMGLKIHAYLVCHSHFRRAGPLYTDGSEHEVGYVSSSHAAIDGEGAEDALESMIGGIPETAHSF